MSTAFVSLKGKLLLDGGKLCGSFFHRTVVLICQHDPEGAFGLVLNKHSETNVGDALVADLPALIRDQKIFVGGPVQPAALSYLHTQADFREENIFGLLGLGHSIDELMEIGESLSTETNIRVFAGYAGWSPGQLDDEIRREAWLIHPGTIELTFYPKPEELWKFILRQKGWPYQLLADAPEDMAWN